jgi:hypothetical protein
MNACNTCDALSTHNISYAPIIVQYSPPDRLAGGEDMREIIPRGILSLSVSKQMKSYKRR